MQKNMENEHEKFTISQFGILIREDKCLILKDSKTGKWLFPGGRIEVGEEGEKAFRRELKEELGFDSFENLGVVDYDIAYTLKDNKPVCAIGNLIKNDNSDIILDSEHTEFRWVTLEESREYEFVWLKAQRMIKKAFRYKKLLEKNNEK